MNRGNDGDLTAADYRALTIAAGRLADWLEGAALTVGPVAVVQAQPEVDRLRRMIPRLEAKARQLEGAGGREVYRVTLNIDRAGTDDLPGPEGGLNAGRSARQPGQGR